MARFSSYGNATADKAINSLLHDIFSFQCTEEGHAWVRGGKGLYLGI